MACAAIELEDGTIITSKTTDFLGVSNDKLDFLYDKETILNKYDSTFKYGFNFTELDAIREVSGVSFLYMFTGIKYSELSKYVIEDDTL